MVQRVAEKTADAGSHIYVRPLSVSFWEGTERQLIEDLTNCEEVLKDAVQSKHTVWIKARLDGLDEKERKWFDGSLEAWEPLGGTPTVCWEEMESILRAVDLEPPESAPTEDEEVAAKLLRAIPYLYVQGAFATIRDVFSSGGSARRAKGLAAFPLVGFNPVDPDSEQSDVGYTMVRTMVGVVEKRVVVTIRLPDIPCAESDEDLAVIGSDTSKLDVPDRFFPLLKEPDGLDVATAIGIHQATTARAVGKRIRDQLDIRERRARALNNRREDQPLAGQDKVETDRRRGLADRRKRDSVPPKWRRGLRRGGGNRRKEPANRRTGPVDRRSRDVGPPGEGRDRRQGPDDQRKITDAQLRKDVISAGPEISRLSEITHRLDQQLARIMRRFGGSPADAQRFGSDDERLVPQEVRLRYKFALDDIRQLRDDCHLASQTVNEALTAFEHDQRERLQFVAALLASAVLIPTLIAGVFGANFDVPANEDPAGFPAFLGVVVLLAVISLLTLRMARKHDWHPSPKKYLLPGLAAGAIVLAFAAFLVISGRGSKKEDCCSGQAESSHTTNLPSTWKSSPSTTILPPRRRSQTRSVWTADSLTPPDSG
jgi:hypothetical protein